MRSFDGLKRWIDACTWEVHAHRGIAALIKLLLLFQRIDNVLDRVRDLFQTRVALKFAQL